MSSSASKSKTSRKRKRRDNDNDDEWQPSDNDASDSDYNNNDELNDCPSDSAASAGNDEDIDLDLDDINLPSQPKRKRARISSSNSGSTANSSNSSNSRNKSQSSPKNVQNDTKNKNTATTPNTENNENQSSNVPNTNESNESNEHKSDSECNASDADAEDADDADDADASEADAEDAEDAEEDPEDTAKLEEIKRQYRTALGHLKLLSSAAEYKQVLSYIKNLRDEDRDTPLSDRVKLGGKKDELFERCKDHILCILCGKAPKSSESRGWGSMFWFGGRRGIDWDEWRQGLLKFLGEMAASKKKEKKRKESGVFRTHQNTMKSLEKRLQTLEKAQIIEMIVNLIENDEEAGSNDNNNNNSSNNAQRTSLLEQVMNLVPQPNLDDMFDKHKKLINAINKARPWTRYGSSSDHYCYKRCKSAIAHARTAIINDGNFLLKTKEWDVILKFLKVSVRNCESFPSWDMASDNGDKVKVKNQLKKMYLQTIKALGMEGNDSASSKKNKSKSKTKSKGKRRSSVAGNGVEMTDEMRKDLQVVKEYFDDEE